MANSTIFTSKVKYPLYVGVVSIDRYVIIERIDPSEVNLKVKYKNKKK